MGLVFAIVSEQPTDETPSEFSFMRMSGQAFQRVYVCDFTHACPDGPFTCPDKPPFK